MDNKNVFAANLQRYMKEAGKTRRDVSNDLGISYYTFSDWCNGKKYPRMNRVEQLANYFGCQKSDLIEQQQKKPTENGGLTESQKALIDFARNVPEDKAAQVLRILRAIVEDE